MILLQTTTIINPSVSWWTVLAALAATISAISAFRSSRFAKRAISLAGQTYEDRQANFSLYLIDNYRWTFKKDSKKKFLLFHISITNKSDSKSSFKAELEIEYIRDDNSVARAIIPHDENHQINIKNKSLTMFSNEIRIEERGLQSKWLIFEQPTTVFNEYRIEKYTIRIIDTHGILKTANSFILKELNNE
jgi:hypothetical protein